MNGKEKLKSTCNRMWWAYDDDNLDLLTRIFNKWKGKIADNKFLFPVLFYN